MSRSVWCRAGRSRGPSRRSSRRPRSRSRRSAARQEPEPRGGQLDRERQAVEARADVGHRLRVVVGEQEVRPRLLSPLDEEAHGRGADDVRRRERPVAGLREGERRHREHLLAPDLERLPARHENLQSLRALEERGDVAGGLHHLLEVVEQEQNVPRPELLGERLAQVLPAGDAGSDRLDERLERPGSVAGVRQVDEVDAVGEAVAQIGRGLDGEPRLADAAGAGESHQAHARGAEVLADREQVELPPDQLRGLHGQVVRRRIERPQPGEVGPQAVRRDLEETLAAREVAQAVLPEVTQLDAVAEARLDERTRRLRDEDLPAVRRGHDPGRAVDVDADVGARGQPCLARVELPSARAAPTAGASPPRSSPAGWRPRPRPRRPPGRRRRGRSRPRSRPPPRRPGRRRRERSGGAARAGRRSRARAPEAAAWIPRCR